MAGWGFLPYPVVRNGRCSFELLQPLSVANLTDCNEPWQISRWLSWPVNSGDGSLGFALGRETKPTHPYAPREPPGGLRRMTTNFKKGGSCYACPKMPMSPAPPSDSRTRPIPSCTSALSHHKDIHPSGSNPYRNADIVSFSFHRLYLFHHLAEIGPKVIEGRCDLRDVWFVAANFLDEWWKAVTV
jgi:hypothetical protein